MPRHVDVWIDGIRLQDAEPLAKVRQLTEDVPALEVTAAAPVGWDGQRAPMIRRRSLRVTLAAQIHEVYDLARRSQAQENIAAWAQGQLLTVSYRPGRRLRVKLTKAPSIGKARDYTQEITAEWTAFEVPYWEDEIERIYRGTNGASGTVSLWQAGSKAAPVDAEIIPAAALSALTLTCGGESLVFSFAAPVAAGTVIRIGHTGEDWLTAAAGESSILTSLQPQSADILTAQPGHNEATWTADASCEVTLRTRGRYE